MRAKTIKESIGGAGYAVYGGGWGKGFGNPSLGARFSGRGIGFGGSANLSGGPNLMYTYEVKPLNQYLQQQPTTQGDIEYIHPGTEISGYILNTDEKIEGRIINVEEDGDNNILWYIVLDKEGRRRKVDPTTSYVIEPEDLLYHGMMDVVRENFFPELFEKAARRIPLKRNPDKLIEEFEDNKELLKSIKTVSFAHLINSLNNVPSNLFKGKKIDIEKFHNWLTKTTAYKKGLLETKELLKLISPYLGISKYFAFDKETRQDLNFQEKLLDGEEISCKSVSEIENKDDVTNNDYVVRSRDGNTEPAYYRIEGVPEKRKPLMTELSCMKSKYVQDYGDPSLSLWNNFLNTRPARVGHIIKHGKSFEKTADVDDYKDDVYK